MRSRLCIYLLTILSLYRLLWAHVRLQAPYKYSFTHYYRTVGGSTPTAVLQLALYRLKRMAKTREEHTVDWTRPNLTRPGTVPSSSARLYRFLPSSTLTVVHAGPMSSVPSADSKHWFPTSCLEHWFTTSCLEHWFTTSCLQHWFTTSCLQHWFTTSCLRGGWCGKARLGVCPQHFLWTSWLSVALRPQKPKGRGPRMSTSTFTQPLSSVLCTSC